MTPAEEREMLIEACRREMIQLALEREIRRDILLGWRTRFDAVPQGTPGLTFNMGNGEGILDLDENELPRSTTPQNAPIEQPAAADQLAQANPPDPIAEVAVADQVEGKARPAKTIQPDE